MMKRDASAENLEGTVHQWSKHPRERNSSPSTVVNDVPERSINRSFVLQWLEHLDDKEIMRANAPIEVLKLVASKNYNVFSTDSEKAECNRKSRPSARIPPLTPPRHPAINPGRPMPTTFRAKSVAIGDGWNAKGVQKAKSENWLDALACWDKALEIRIQVLGHEHKDVANTLNNMGVALGRMERHEEAMEFLERVLKIRSKIYGPVHLEIASTLHNIGNVFQQMGEYRGSLQCFMRAKSIQRRLLGDKDIQLARTCNAIGHLHFELGRAYNEALKAYTEAREIFIQAGVKEDNEEFEDTIFDITEVQGLLQSTDLFFSTIRG